MLQVQSSALGTRGQGTGVGRLCKAPLAAGNWGSTFVWKREDMVLVTVVCSYGRGGMPLSFDSRLRAAVTARRALLVPFLPVLAWFDQGSCRASGASRD